MHRLGIVFDIQRGRVEGLLPQPWQTDTSIGDWHYWRSTGQWGRCRPASQDLYAIVLGWPENGQVTIKSLGTDSLPWPDRKPCDIAFALQVSR